MAARVVVMDLFTAAGQPDLRTVQQLLQAGADVDQGDLWTGCQTGALHWSRSQTPALSHAINTQLRTRKIPPSRGYFMPYLCLYGIRAPIKDTFYARAIYHALTTH